MLTSASSRPTQAPTLRPCPPLTTLPFASGLLRGVAAPLPTLHVCWHSLCQPPLACQPLQCPTPIALLSPSPSSGRYLLPYLCCFAPSSGSLVNSPSLLPLYQPGDIILPQLRPTSTSPKCEPTIAQMALNHAQPSPNPTTSCLRCAALQVYRQHDRQID